MKFDFQMTFKRPSHDRQLTFEEIAKETRLPINEIEILVMKALAQGLVKGAIDQVGFYVIRIKSEVFWSSFCIIQFI